jgi:hypothetical protein
MITAVISWLRHVPTGNRDPRSIGLALGQRGAHIIIYDLARTKHWFARGMVEGFFTQSFKQLRPLPTWRVARSHFWCFGLGVIRRIW